MKKEASQRMKIGEFETKAHYQRLLEQFIAPIRQEIISTSAPQLHLGESGAVYTAQRADMEALIRPLWGLAPYWLDKEDQQLKHSYIDKILQGTDPKSPEYWGDITDYDQYIVEMPAICLFLLMHEEAWRNYPQPHAYLQVLEWLSQALNKKIPKNNWTFFKVWIRTTTLKYGLPTDTEALAAEFALIDTMYLGQGWYYDGKVTQKDYYTAFAFHYYGLMYAALMKEEDPERSALFIQRATDFAQEYKYYFDDEGAAVPFGRSLTYRFAQGAFFSALIYANVEAIPWGEMKSLLAAHIKQWLDKPMFTHDGRLSIGYHYENLVMAEGYNAPGSPYWSFKFFILLATPEAHPFWQAQASQIKKRKQVLIEKGNMLITTAASGKHVLAYPAGLFINDQAHASDKYSKFVYSTKFGFSVAKAAMTYGEGAFDNTLAIAIDDTYYRSKGKVSEYQLTESSISYRWQPYPGVSIQTIIYPLGEWHVRVHEVTTTLPITVKEGGFSVPVDAARVTSNKEEKNTAIVTPYLTSQICGIQGYETVATIRPEPNTSLFFPRSILPYLTAELPAGQHRLIALVGGLVTKREDGKQ